MTAIHPIVPGVRFKDVVDFPGYAVADDGTGWSCRETAPGGRIGSTWHQLRPVPRGEYLRLGMWRDGKLHWKTLHKLILEAFVGPCPPGMEACHDPNPDPSDNRLVNLRWDTPTGNLDDARRLGRITNGSRRAAAKIDESDIPRIRDMIAAGVPRREIGAMFGLSHTSINDIAVRKTWSHVP